MDRKKNLLRAINRRNPKWLPYWIEDDPLDEGIIKFIYPYDYNAIIEGGLDSWNIGWTPSIERKNQDMDMVCFPKYFPIQNLEKLSTYSFPDPTQFKVNKKSQALLKRKGKEKLLILGYHPLFLFERAWALMSMESFLINLVAEENKMKQLLGKIIDYQIEVGRHYIKMGADGCFVTEDLGTQRSLMISPPLWRKLFKPELKRAFKIYKDSGKYVFMHSCGHIMEIVKDLIDIGVDVLHPIQARANDIVELKYKYGKEISFCGGVDTHILMHRQPKEVQQETIQRISQLSPGGGYIIAPDQKMPFPRKNIEAFVETINEYGKYSLIPEKSSSTQ